MPRQPRRIVDGDTVRLLRRRRIAPELSWQARAAAPPHSTRQLPASTEAWKSQFRQPQQPSAKVRLMPPNAHRQMPVLLNTAHVGKVMPT